MTALDTQPTQPKSYSLAHWQGGHKSLKEEYEYWIDDIDGTIPAELSGTLFRNGPGLLDVNGDRLHHPFDGDGMICAISITAGKAHFRNRYVKTAGYLAEQKAGKILYRGVFGTQKPGGWLANVFDLRFKNIANTNVMYWGKKLLALWEAGLPYRLNPATLETLGEDQLQGLLGKGASFSAHPRFDPGDGVRREPRMVNFGTATGLSTRLTVYEFDLDGNCLEQYSHNIPGLGFFHDFALTPNYAIFFQNPVVLNPVPFVLGLKSAGQSIQFKPDQPTTVWVIPRNGKDPVQQFETDACFVFHHANAFETTAGLTIDSICYDHFPTLGPNDDYRSVDFETFPISQLWRITVNFADRSVRRTQVSPRCCEFPSVNPQYVGKPYQYIFMGVAAPKTENSPLQALQKLDVTSDPADPSVQTWSAAPNGFIGEPVFVPKPNRSETEDAGWLLSLVYDGAEHRSELVILDAEDLTQGAIARLKLNHHIPYGLHGCFTPEVFLCE